MPTGYTSDLYDGKDVSFETFALKCSRAMGAAIHQRDDSGDAEISFRQVSDYYLERIQKAKADLSRALERSYDEWEEMQDEEIRSAEEYRKNYIKDQRTRMRLYEEMLDEVIAWVPPTDKHQGLKDFMIQQLERSIDFDGTDYVPSVPEHLGVEEYADIKIAAASKAVSNAVESLDKERKSVQSQNEWVIQLRNSLKGES